MNRNYIINNFPNREWLNCNAINASVFIYFIFGCMLLRLSCQNLVIISLLLYGTISQPPPFQNVNETLHVSFKANNGYFVINRQAAPVQKRELRI